LFIVDIDCKRFLLNCEEKREKKNSGREVREMKKSRNGNFCCHAVNLFSLIASCGFLLSEKCVCGAHLHDFWISSARNLNIRG
jgi:hypothetical protein